jgi:hypothetical protein
VASTLAPWLGTLRADALAALLSRRPEVLAPPAPRDLPELASRLQGRLGVLRAYQTLTLPAVQLVDVMNAYRCRRCAELVAIVGEDMAAGVDQALVTLAELALVWEFDGQLSVAGELASLHRYPLGLGPDVATLLDRRTPTELRGLAAALGLDVPASKREAVRELAARYADGEWVRNLAATASPTVRAVLDALAWRNPALLGGFGGNDGAAAAERGNGNLPRDPDAEAWLLRHGLLQPDEWRLLMVPREVSLALRGPDYRPPFDPEPPLPALAPAALEAVAAEAAAAASALVDQVGAVLCAGPVARLKAGGVGAREQRRLARSVAADEASVRFVLELAYRAGLLAGVADELLPTDRFDGWLAADPADRLLPLLAAWLELPTVPTPEGTALAPELTARVTDQVRSVLLSVAAGLPQGQALADEGYLLDVLRWRAPSLARHPEGVEAYVGPLWAEAGRLGIIALGCLSPLGRALVGLDPDALARAAGDMLAHPTGTAIFQADLTALVAGPPDAALAALLDGAAQRESRGAASTWRFSTGSVRRALDAGQSVDELLAALRAVATDGALPQPLEYLVADVARRHGEVRVRAVGCVLRADDQALLTEILAARGLSDLGLTRLAPTVLASCAAPGPTLAALRSAGYAPIGEDGTGEPLVERLARRRAKPPAASRRPQWHQDEPQSHPLAVEPAELAEFLLAAPSARVAPPRQPQPADLVPATIERERALHVVTQPTLEVIEARAPQLDPRQRQLLADAIDEQLPVRIDYVDGDGRFSTRVIEEIELSGAVIEAWCRLRDDERMFLLDRIGAVAEA